MTWTFAASVYEKLGEPVAAARGLPNEAYTSPDYFEIEQKLLFGASWTFAIAASEIPDPGDITPVTVAGQPLILVRGKNRQVRAFANVCPHRGSELVEGPRKGAHRVTCPYHAWCFGLDGKLQNRPHFFGPEKHDQASQDTDCGLFEVRCAAWQDWIFVNLDGTAPPLADWVAPIEAHVAGFDFSAFRLSRIMTFEFECNWKLAVENYTDNYHVFRVHPALDQLQTSADRFGMTPEGMCLLNVYHMTREDRGADLPVYPGLEGHDRKASFGLMFPSFGFAFYPSSIAMAVFVPLAVDRTQMRMLFYYVGEAAGSEQHAAARELNETTWAELNEEDEGICRKLQRGRAASAYDGGRFSPYWDKGTIHFARLAVAAMTGRLNDPKRTAAE